MNKSEFSWWILGFIEGEGNFNARMQPDILFCEFNIFQKSQNDLILEQIRDFFGCGKVYKNMEDKYCLMSRYRVSKIKDLSDIIVPFFENYPPQTTKTKEIYSLWKELVLLKSQKYYRGEYIDRLLIQMKAIRNDTAYLSKRHKNNLVEGCANKGLQTTPKYAGQNWLFN